MSVGSAPAAAITTVTVGDPGNTADASGYGAVAYTYDIGKYEVTAGQYCEFLNAVAETDTYELYNSGMAGSTQGCGIARSGSSGSYTYSVLAGKDNRPVNYTDWGAAARFANWLHNGQQTGDQDLTTTEDGAYYLNGATDAADLLTVSREADWKWAITSEDEWYKAAFYKGGGANAGYWDYPTSTDDAPGRDMTEATNPGNNANYKPYGTAPINGSYYFTDVGEFELSDSPYGTFDQGGSVLEWNEAIIGSARVYRSGSWWSVSGALHAETGRDSLSPTFEAEGIGFRVSYVPEPASIAVLALGSIGMLLRRRGGDEHKPPAR